MVARDDKADIAIGANFSLFCGDVALGEGEPKVLAFLRVCPNNSLKMVVLFGKSNHYAFCFCFILMCDVSDTFEPMSGLRYMSTRVLLLREGEEVLLGGEELPGRGVVLRSNNLVWSEHKLSIL